MAVSVPMLRDMIDIIPAKQEHVNMFMLAVSLKP